MKAAQLELKTKKAMNMVKASESDKEIICEILCQSFDTNRSVNYVIKQDRRRKKRIRHLMEYSFGMCMMFGNVYLTEDRKGCALILFPEMKRPSLKSVTLDLKLAISSIGLGRVMKIMRREEEIKKYYPKTAVTYLWFIGVLPENQNKGIGSKLMADILIEHGKTPIYLETSMIQNVNFYKNFGFQIYSELEFDHKLFLMKKEPET